ncbi:MAG: cob(I)yrinic acid a,c-diamide adenosyltransferase [Candidatus Thermoplasmatota archaeon]|jgi:ATP:cob(I)alamin adenosyltransferase|nr:cob(I)yrinic acid a,c-diamide adenosyltransferase [Candidatus Thermoplasmatota archaeon]MCL5791286.1 cob(I)yrinic acid a,c-diamide adenosyltransferase [Candidatus Thermoplasmatota archaeon]
MYTRRGDKGETDTGTGMRVTKGSHIIDTEGDFDELNSFVGFALVNTKWDDIRKDLEQVQVDLFVCGEHITAQGGRRTITEERVRWLEAKVNEYRKEYGKIKLFVIPGGSVESTSLHMARTVCRRLERDLVKSKDEVEISPVIEEYVNRLSSLLFFHSIISNRRLGIEERIWYLRELP